MNNVHPIHMIAVVPQQPKLLATIDEAAEALRISKSMVYLLLERHEIASLKIGRMRRIPIDALNAYVAERLERSEAPYGR